MTQLEDMIATRSTELHRYHDQAKEVLESLMKEKARIRLRLETIDDDILAELGMIAKCKRLAGEQGYPNLFD